MVFEERSGIAWLLAGWQLKGVRQNTDNGRRPLCLEEEDVMTTQTDEIVHAQHTKQHYCGDRILLDLLNTCPQCHNDPSQ
jgi:hypothetical protein